MDKTRTSKIWKGVKRALLCIAIIPMAMLGIATLILACRPVQRWVCGHVSDIASQAMGSRFAIKGLFLNPFTQNISLQGIYMEDTNGDTLAYLGSLDLKLRSMKLSQNRFHIESISIDSVEARMLADTNGVFNYEKLFGIEEDTSSQEQLATRYHLDINRMRLTNLNLAYVSNPRAEVGPEMNFENLNVRDINLYARNITVSDRNMSVIARIDSLRAKEHCGLEIRKLGTKVRFSTNGLYMRDLKLKTPDTDLIADSLNLVYSGFDDFGEFLDSVSIQAQINEGSVMGLDDIGHFVPDIYGYGIAPGVSLVISGPVSNMWIQNLDLRYGSDTRLQADAYIKGLPDITNLKFNLNINQLKTCQQDLMTLHEPCDTTPLLDMPNILNELGTLSMTASCKGTSKNCQLIGDLKSKLGNVNTTVVFRGDGRQGDLTGFIDAGKLNLGAIADSPETLGLLSTHDSVKVHFAENGNINGKIAGSVDSLGLLGYYYQHIKINGDFTQDAFDGQLRIKDRNLDLDFDGVIDMGAVSKYKFALNLNHADLKATHILDDSVDVLSFGLEADLSASNIDNINGDVRLSRQVVFQKDDQTLVINNLNFRSIVDHYVCGLPDRKFTINSDYVDATLSGRVHSMQILEIMSNFAYMILPSLDYQNKNIFNIKTQAKRPTKLDYNDPEFMRFLGNKFDFKVTFKNMKRITNMFMPELFVSNNTMIEGGFHTLRKNSWITFRTDKIAYEDYSVDSLRISARLLDDLMDLEVKSDSIILSEDMKLKHPHILVTARHDTIAYALLWNNTKDDIRNEGNIMGDIVVSPHPLPKHFPILKGHTLESGFWTWNKEWKIHPSEYSIDSTSFTVQDFMLRHQDQYFAANGTISADPDDKFRLESNNFDLSLLNHFIGNNTIGGNATGFTEISNIYGDLPLVEMENQIDTLRINDVVLGPFSAKCKFQPGDSLVSIDFYTINKMNKKNLHGCGTFDFTNQEIDFAFDIGNLSSKVLRPLFQNYLSVPSTQFLDGQTHITGPISNPEIISELKLKGGYFKIDYLGVKYTIQDGLNIAVDNKKIELKKVKLLSGKTGLAYLEGTINHQNFDNFKMNVNLQLKNFTLLDAKRTDSAAFWGKAFASGNVNITGDPTRMINIDAKVRTDKNTQVFMPLYGASEVSNDFNFVTFKNPADTLENEIHRQKADLSDIRMNFNLEVTPDAEVQAILDETTGNILKASASGNLKLDVTGSGDFNMYGTLAVERGDYLFTMSNVLSKKFEVVKGGTLRWNGDPLDAEVDLSAMYKLRKVNLYNLMVDETYRDKKVPVQCLLKMKGNIMTPEISFGVKIEDNGGVAQGQIDNLDEGNINKQMISLLLLNQFQPLPGLRSSENSMFSDFNAGEIVTNKINSMLSDISDKFDVGVNYQMGDGASAEELDVAVSTQLFDDRVQVSTNLGVQGDSKNQTNRNTNGVVGEVEIEVKLNKSGSMKLNVYNKANEDELQESPYKQGVGFSYKKEFDNMHELMQSLKGILKRKENK